MTYCVSVYHPNDDPNLDGEWVPVYRGVSQWGLRGVLRTLYAECYSNVSVLVEREAPEVLIINGPSYAVAKA